jgi:chromosome segregation ATPase
MLVEIYDALKEAGASEEKARAAATSLTGRDVRLDRLDRHMREELVALGARVSALEHRIDDLAQDVRGLKSDVTTLKSDVATLKTDVAVIRAELALMKWMHGITIGGILALIIQAFFG